jgi:hypothetical protein
VKNFTSQNVTITLQNSVMKHHCISICHPITPQMAQAQIFIIKSSGTDKIRVTAILPELTDSTKLSPDVILNCSCLWD